MPMLPGSERMLRVRNTSRTMPAALVHVERVALGRDDARRVLAAVLQQQQPVVEELIDGRTGDDAENPAHGTDFPGVVKGQLYFKRLNERRTAARA